MKVLVSGGGGFLGRSIVDRLVKRGHVVRAIVRPTSPKPAWPDEVEVFRADLRVEKDLVPAFKGVDAVLHLAAAVTGNEDTQFASTVVATERFLEAMAKSAVKRLVHVSSLVVYDSVSTPEFVVMFVPSDGIYQAALAQDPALIEYGVQQQVLMATPTTLIGLLWAVHYGWRQELIAQSAREIADSARELHSRLGRFVEPFAKVGRQLDSAVGAYNEAIGSFEHRVIPQVRKIEQAGAASERKVLAPDAVEITARSLSARPGFDDQPEPAPRPLAAAEPPARERISRAG